MSVMNTFFISTMWLKTLANSLWLFHIDFQKVVFERTCILLNTFFDIFYVNYRVRLVFRHPGIKMEIATADFISKQIQIRHVCSTTIYVDNNNALFSITSQIQQIVIYNNQSIQCLIFRCSEATLSFCTVSNMLVVDDLLCMPSDLVN